jgi:hypothetical protein
MSAWISLKGLEKYDDSDFEEWRRVIPNAIPK